MRARRRRGVGTPDRAQQAGVLPNCQTQHDREKSCSKHVDARNLQGQELRQSGKEATAQNPCVFEGSPRPGQATCGVSPAGAEKFPTAVVLFKGRRASCPGSVLGSQLLAQRSVLTGSQLWQLATVRVLSRFPLHPMTSSRLSMITPLFVAGEAHDEGLWEEHDGPRMHADVRRPRGARRARGLRQGIQAAQPTTSTSRHRRDSMVNVTGDARQPHSRI
jgi:hypothetical protein